MKLNPLQQMAVDTGMLEIKLEVKSDETEYEVAVNGIVCDYCGDHEFESEAHYVGEAQICDSCYEGCIA
jgi:formylmethanofuran dehydrogenase subunit E